MRHICFEAYMGNKNVSSRRGKTVGNLMKINCINFFASPFQESTCESFQNCKILIYLCKLSSFYSLYIY